MRIGRAFREFYADPALGTDIDGQWLAWLLDGRGPAGDPPVTLGPDVLCLAGGPSTRLRTERAPGALTVADLADVDPANMPWPDGRFSAVVAVLVLHHLPDAAAQDAALAEWARLLRPGGVLAGLNPIEGPHFRRLDQEGWCTPVDPLAYPERLAAAGFAEARVRVWSLVGFTAVAA
ncbi:MAG TPA: methyltransferase domain-containing protein [Mycobacteriales bacterium]|nr:methyltransferase domain-containing protein [Mycobacteriales bacterium]